MKASKLVDAEIEVEVELVAPEPLDATPEALPLRVVFEDEHLLVIDKPARMVVHAGPGHASGTLVNAVLYHVGAEAEELPVLPGNDATRPGVVHRIDRDTSGLVVVAKHMRAQEGLASQLRAHTMRRRYLGVVRGVPDFATRTIRSLHGRDPRDRRRFTWEVSDGRVAVTHARALRGLAGAGELEFRLETGRTHQIRMHCKMIGLPIVGDALYGGLGGPEPLRSLAAGLGRHALHAASLGFTHPITGVEIDLESPLPPELVELIGALCPR